MALDSTALITLDRLKRYLGIDKSTKDNLLEDCINSASSMISTHCNRNFVKTTHTSYLNGTGRNRISLPEFPVGEVTSIKVIDSAGTPRDLLLSSDTIDNTALIDISALYLRKSYTFPKGIKNIKIEYSAGYENIPENIQKVCVEIAAMIYYESKDGEERLGVKSESKGVSGASSKSFTTSSADYLSQLDGLRRVNI